MNVSPLPTVSAASIAGTDRAAASALPAAVTSEKSAAASRSESVDSIEKGNRSEDSGADGRQTLDTFERRQEEPDAESETETSAPNRSFLEPLDTTAKTGGHLDFTA